MEREKALEMAMSQIDKHFGKGSVMRMGDKAHVDVGAVPTGALALDLALGIGGLPRGRIVEIYGPESSGKCLTADTHVWTDRGLETVAELFARCGQPTSCTSRITSIADLGVRAVNERGELEAVAALTHNNRRPVLRLQLRSGREVKVTHNHPLRVMNERGFMVWRQAGSLRQGDVLVSALFGAVEAACGDRLSEDEAVFLGYLVAEGSLGYSTQLRFTNGDLDVGQEYTRLVEQLFGARVKCYNGIDYAVHSKSLRTQLAEQYGLDYVTAEGKTVPACVRTGGHKIQRAFLSALFEGDGWIDPLSTVGLGTASEQLARQVQLLLYGLGIPCTVGSTFNQKYGRDYWSVTINPAVTHRFIQEIGFRSHRRQEQVEAHFRVARTDPQFENVPGVAGLVRDLRDDIGGDREFDRIAGDLFRPDMGLACSRTRLERIVAWGDERVDRLSGSGRALLDHLRCLAQGRYTYEPIVSIDDAGTQPTFDLAMPLTHSFLANGVLSHNTTLAMHVVAEAQRNGGIAAYIDAEHAMDPVYARAVGVNVDELLISQPDTGEQALEIADMLIRSGAIDVLVVDSVAALTPRAEIEGEMGDSHVGLQARLMSQALRKLTGTLSKTNTIAIFINQLREKIGVMYGCLSYGTRITLADGSQEKIGKIVNQRLPVEVLSYDPELDAVVPKKVVNWFDNGRTDQFLQFTVGRGGGNGRAQFACTANHKIRTPGGWREAQELSVGDRVLQAVPHHLSGFQWAVVLGGLMGGGALSPTRSGRGGRYRFDHCAGQAEYADWKGSHFANVGASRSVRASDGAVAFDVPPLPELAELRRAVYIGGKKVFSDDYLKQLTPLSLAVWYTDGGSFTQDGSGRSEICVEAMEATTRARVVAYLADTWGINAKLISSGAREKAVLGFAKDETAKLHALIAPFVHPSMQHKLLARYRGRFAVEPVFVTPEHRLVPMPITAIGVKPRAGSMHRFDIEVEGTHNYFADGVMVHNSPEVTPGGRALKFYSSVRLDIRRIEAIKDGTEVIGNRTRVKVVKNKCVAAGTTVFDPTTGLTHRIEDMVAKGEGASVVAADKLGNLHPAPITARLDQGEREVIGLHFRDGTELWATPDHRVLTEHGWQEAGTLKPGDAVARPRRAGSFGHQEPVTPDHARLLGYLIGDGYVGGKTPCAFINIQESLQQDAMAIAAALGCDAHRRGLETSFSHRKGEKNGLLALVRWAGIWGHLAPEKRIPPAFFSSDVSAEVVANLLLGLWETDGWVSREQTGGIRVGYCTTSKQLAHQLHWLLLRWGIGSSVRVYDPTSHRPSILKGRIVQGKLPCWEVRVSGIDNVRCFAEALPMWGPRGRVLMKELARPELRVHRGSQRGYLPVTQNEPVLAYLRGLGVTPGLAAQLIGDGVGDPKTGLRSVLGGRRIRRDRLQRLADALESEFLGQLLDDDVWYDRIKVVSPPEWRPVYDIEVEGLHNFVANDLVVHNCSSPFKQAEFDIMFGKGISREGSLLDVGVDLGLVKKSGAWYTYDGEQLGQGRENAKGFLVENPEIMVEISERIRQQVAPAGAQPDPDDLPITLE